MRGNIVDASSDVRSLIVANLHDKLYSLLINNSFCLLNLIELMMQILNFILKRFDFIGGFR